jgi:N utilization substance protein B
MMNNNAQICVKIKNRGRIMSRSELREHVFRMLFRIEFNSEEEMKEQENLYFDLLDEISEDSKNYILNKYRAITEKQDEIDAILNEVSDGWKTSRMNRVDLTILRLATYEVKWDEEVPTGVAINEAVELAKKYSSDDGPSFINGILAKVSK